MTAEEREIEDVMANLDAAIADLDARLTESNIASLYRALLSSPDTIDPDVGRYVYAEVGRACVDPSVREAAEKAIAWCVVEDGLLADVPPIVWFAPESTFDRAYVARWQARDWAYVSARRPIMGAIRYSSDAVWLRYDLSIAEVVETAAHEVRHLADAPGTTPGESEADAHWYEERMGGRLRAFTA